MTKEITYQVLRDFEFEELGAGEWKVTSYIGFDVENIEIPAEINGKRIVAIGERIFNRDIRIKNVKIAEGIKAIGDDAFRACKSLESVILPGTLEVIGKYAFSETKIQDIIFGNKIRDIGEGVCYDCYWLRRIVFPDNLTVIAKQAFAGCGHLENLVLPEKVKEIRYWAFFGCGIKHLYLPEGLEVMEEGAFGGNNIETLMIPQSMKLIGKEAIKCPSLTTVVILPGCQVALGDGIFHQGQVPHDIIGRLTSVYVPASVTTIGNVFLADKSLVIEVDRKDEDGKVVRDAWGNEVTDDALLHVKGDAFPKNLTVYCEMGSAMMDIARSKQIKCAEYKQALSEKLESLQKEVVEQAEESKKYNLYSPDEILYPFDADDKLIRDDSGITVASHVKVIKKGAGNFAKNAIVNFNDDSLLERIESGAFYQCFTHFDYSCNGKALVLPSRLKLIEKDAFKRCELKKVYVPSSCVVEEGAFPSTCKVITKAAGGDNGGSDDALEALSNLANNAVEKMKGFFGRFKK